MCNHICNKCIWVSHGGYHSYCTCPDVDERYPDSDLIVDDECICDEVFVDYMEDYQ